MNTHAPLKPLSKRKIRQRKKPWMTKGIIKSISTKNKLYAKCYQKNKLDLLSYYKKYLNKLTTVKRLAKEQYYTSQLIERKQNMKKQWTIINELLEKNIKRHQNISKLVDENNNFVATPEICNVLNNYFVNVGPNLSAKIDNDISAPKNISSNPKSLFFQPIKPPEVYREINKLNLKKAAGPENIPLTFYKKANECISNFLCLLYNKCIENGFFPSLLKQAKVIPIYKSGKRYLANNYRPISLLSPISKIFESLISIRLISFLEDNNIISEQQFGFRKQHSTTHVVTDVQSQISKNLDNKQHTCVILLDFRKAFDTVNHQILVRKLEKYGIRGNILEMF